MSYLFVLIVAACFSGSFAELPDFIKVCKRNAPDVNDCIRNSVIALQPLLIKGIPDLNVPPLEPLLIPKLDLNRGTRGVSLKAVFKNNVISGASDFIIKDLKADLEKNTFKVTIKLPHIYFTGEYKMNLNIIFLPIRGEGRNSGNFTNYEADVTMNGHKETIKGVEHMQFVPIDIKIRNGQTKLTFDNLFSGNALLGSATNQAINENSDLFISELIPSLQKAFSDIFTEQANNILRSASYEELFPLS